MTAHNDNDVAALARQEKNIVTAFLTLCWLFLALRIWTRTYIIASFGWDDASMIVATMIFTAFCAAMLFIDSHGGGTHVTSIPQLQSLTKFVVISEATYIMAVLFLKISLGIFFARIVVKPYQLWIIYATMTICVISAIATFFYVIFRCGADIKNYALHQLADECMPQPVDQFFTYQLAAVTSLTDVILATLPIFILWNSNMHLRSKLSVGAILSLAAIGCICSFIRFRFANGLTEVNDFFWNATNVGIWSTIEPGTGIIAGCLATLRPFMKRFCGVALSIGSSARKSAKQYSRSSRSNATSSNQRTTVGNDIPTPHNHHRGTDLEIYENDVAVELRSNVSNKGDGDSTVGILEDVDGLWPGPPERTVSRELRRNVYEQPLSRGTRSMRSGRTSDVSDHPVPPVPCTLRHDDDMV